MYKTEDHMFKIQHFQSFLYDIGHFTLVTVVEIFINMVYLSFTRVNNYPTYGPLRYIDVWSSALHMLRRLENSLRYDQQIFMKKINFLMKFCQRF